MRGSSGFYSLYLFVLLLFVSMGIGGYFYLTSQNKNHQISSHILLQMGVYEESIKQIVRVCLKKYGLKECKVIDLDLGDGFLAKSRIKEEAMWIVLDLSLEYQNPLNSLILRKSKREIWEIKES